MKRRNNQLEPSTNPLIQLSEAFDSIRSPMYTDEFLARVLAWACLSGFCEACVSNQALHSVVMLAARRFKIQGGMIPDREAIFKHWKPALEELYNFGAKTPWLPKLMARYHVVGWEQINYQEWMPEFRTPTGGITNGKSKRRG